MESVGEDWVEGVGGEWRGVCRGDGVVKPGTVMRVVI